MRLHTGELQKALENFDRALEQAGDMERNPQTLAMSKSYQGKARVYLTLGDLETAQSFSDRALAIARNLQKREVLATALGLAGELQVTAGAPAKAVAVLEESLALYQTLGNKPGTVSAQTRLGSALAATGDHAGAASRFEQAMQLATELGNQQLVASTLLSQSAEFESQGKLKEAESAAAASLPLSHAASDQLGEARALQLLAQSLDRPAEALKNVSLAIEKFDALRLLIDSPELRTQWRATMEGAYELWIELLMSQHAQTPAVGNDVKALLASERARARGLVESLGWSREGLSRDAPPALLKERRELIRKANALEFKRVLSITNRNVQPPDPDEHKAVLDASRELNGRLLAASPRFAAQSGAPLLQLADIQKQLDIGTLLVEISLGERRSYLWLVSSDKVRSAVLPPRAEIEAQARALYAALTARNAAVTDATVAARRARIAKSDGEASAAAEALSKLLLTPVSDALGTKRLVVVADGALRLIPFVALPEPGKKKPLADTREIVVLPSAAVLAELRLTAPQRPAAANQIAIIADPVYDPDDPRVTLKTASPMLAALEVTRAGRDLGLNGFPRLRFARAEADAVAALSPAPPLSLLGFAATREAATSQAIEEARIVHFATHSLMDTVHPELSGLVLSLVDEAGKPQDGFLRLQEIYELRLRADLVVLSACETAVGKEFQGEGMLALTRGFLAAGAPRVVASLWSVDDRATAELMKRFYQALLGEKLAPGAALRKAQRALAKDGRFAAPYYWAGFALQGEWR